MNDSFPDTYMTFAIKEDEEDPNSEYITCRVSHEMVSKWIKSTPELNVEMEDYVHRLVRTITNEDLQSFSDEDMDAFAEKHGFSEELQSLMMRGILDLKKTLGDEDFYDLYKIDENIETDYKNERWTTLNPDGSVEVVHDPYALPDLD